ncbi:MAG: hypothetical protein HYY16_04655, partial [Planctomycetes bacterium]|nr:hypothetical protein [Planctomycetota bacterium]
MATFRRLVYLTAIVSLGLLPGIPTQAQDAPVVGTGTDAFHAPLVGEGYEFGPLGNPAYPNFKLTSSEPVRLVLQVSHVCVTSV